jgi:alpha-2-macroglobulin
LRPKSPTDFSQTLSWGEYRLEIGAAGMTPVSIDFSSGYYDGGSAKSDTPDTLKVALDKTDVKTGDTVNVKIEARYAGKATVQIVGDRVLATQMVDVAEGGTTLPFTVGADWGPGAYVLATLYKPMDVVAKRMPSRAMGVAWFGIDREARTIGVKLFRARDDEAAPEAGDPGEAGQCGGGRGSLRDGCGCRRRHPQSHALQSALHPRTTTSTRSG